MMIWERPWPRRYGVAAAGVAVATLARILLVPWMGSHQPFPTFYVAITLAAGFGGRGPVLLAIVASYLAANWFVIPPPHSLPLEDPVGDASYFFVCLSIAAFSDVMHAARGRERDAAERARGKQAELLEEFARREEIERERTMLIAELETEQRRLEAVLRQMPAGVVIAEAPSGRFVLANDQVAEIWRRPYVPAGDYHDYESYPAFHQDGRPYRSHERPLARSLAMGYSIKDEEVVYERGDGSRGTMSVSSAPIRAADGTIIAATVVFHDVTDRNRAERMLREAGEGLERRVAERTRELADANAALALEVAERRLAEQSRDELLRLLVRVQEEERGRIARELHDQTGQQLAALKLGLDGLKEDLARRGGRGERLDVLYELTRTLGHDMHRIAWELGTSALEGEDLPTALASYAEEWSAASGVPVHFHRSGRWDDRLPQQVESAAYRVVQEGLTNVLKHAEATRVSLIIERRDDDVSAIVEDDGVGFDVYAPAASPPQGPRMGLVGMRRRAEAAGGSVDVESRPRGGTTIFLRLPAADAGGGNG